MGAAAAAALHDVQQLQLTSRAPLCHNSPGRRVAAEVPCFASHACKLLAQGAVYCLLLLPGGNAGRKDAALRDAVEEDHDATRHRIIDHKAVCICSFMHVCSNPHLESPLAQRWWRHQRVFNARNARGCESECQANTLEQRQDQRTSMQWMKLQQSDTDSPVDI